MKLRAKTLLLVSIPLVVGLLVLMATSWFIILKRFQRLEEERLVRDVNRAVGAFKENLNELDMLCMDWGDSDEIRAFAKSGDEELLATKLDETVFKNMNLNFAAFLDPSGHLLSIRVYDETKRAMVSPSEAFVALFSHPALALLPDAKSGFRRGILLLPEGPMLIAARPILQGGPAPLGGGAVVLGRSFAADEIAHLAGLTHLELDLAPFGRHPLQGEYDHGTSRQLDCADCHGALNRNRFQREYDHRTSMMPGLEGFRISRVGSETINGFTVLDDLYGNPTLLLSVSMPRTDYKHGLATVGALLAALLGVGIAMLVLLSVFLDRLLVSRVRGLVKEVSFLAPEAAALGPKRPVALDELAVLETAVRGTFDALTKTQRDLRSSQENLEAQVTQRTHELAMANQELVEEVAEHLRTGEALRQSEERYRTLVENVNEIIYSMDKEGRLTYLNPVFERLTGFRASDAIGKHFSEFVHPEDLSGLAESAARTLSGFLEPYEFRAFDREGKIHFMRSSSRPIVEDGDTKGLIGVISDLTSLRRSEEKLSRITRTFLQFGPDPEVNMNKLIELAGQLLEADCAFFARLEGPLLRVAGPWNAPVGFSTEVVAEGHVCLDTIRSVPDEGLLVRELPSTPYALTDPSLARFGFRTYLGFPVKFGGQSSGSLCVLFGKGFEPTEEDRRILAILAAAVGVEEERRHERSRIVESERRFKCIFENTNDSIFLLKNGKIIECNPKAEAMFHCRREDLVGRDLSSFSPEFQPDSRGSHETAFEIIAAAAAGQPQNFEWQHKRPDGSLFDAEVTVNSIEIGGEVLVLGIVRDITERKRLDVTRAATYALSEAAISCPNLPELYAAIHKIVGRLMDARNIYIALYEPEDDLFTYPYWVDEYDPQPEPEKPGRGLTAYVFGTGKPLLASPEVFKDLVDRGEVESMGAPSIDWLGVPLKAQDKTTGVLVVQTYQEGIRYGEADLEILNFVSSQVATAIERKRAEEALRRSEERYRALVENQGEGVTYVDYGQTFTFANPAAEEIFGVPPGALVGRSVFEFTSPEFMAETVAQSELRKRGEKSTYETGIIRPDGQRRILLLTAVPMKDKTGAYAGNLGVFFDITGRRRTETERQLLATAIEQSSDGILVTDPEGTILYANHAMEDLTEYSRLELLGQSPRLLKSGQQDKNFYQGFWKTILAGRVWSGRFVNRRKGGGLYYAESTVSPVTDASGALTAFVCSQRDVTKELQWEEELLRARRLETVGLLAGVVAHEVRNPLFAISTLCAALEKNLGDAEQFKPFTTRIQEQVKRLGRLMSDLLMLGRPLDLARFVPCNIREVIAEAIHALQEAGESGPERFSVEGPDFVPDTLGLPDRLVQVFQNLALNALNHSPPEETIRIAIAAIGPELRVTVSDLGPGLPEDLGLRVFEPFQSRRSGGTGLGLAVVRQIVEAHGGRVSAENNAQGPGATFTVWLPLSNEIGSA